MVVSIIMIALAFVWLMYETDFMRVRLESTEYQKAKNSKTNMARYNVGRTIAEWDEYNKAHAKELKAEQKAYAERQAYLKSHTCPICDTLDETRLIEATIIKIGNSTATTRACPNCLAKLEKEVINSQKNTSRKPSVKATTSQPNLIEQVRVGSHHEYIRWNHETNEMEYSSKPKKGYSHRVENDYTTVYHDSLVPKEWLQEHEHDLDGYEPTIELSVNGKSLSVNGDYKQGVIKDFMSQHTERVKAGKKTMTISKGDVVVNCGGGVYVAVAPDKVEEFVK